MSYQIGYYYNMNTSNHVLSASSDEEEDCIITAMYKEIKWRTPELINMDGVENVWERSYRNHCRNCCMEEVLCEKRIDETGCGRRRPANSNGCEVSSFQNTSRPHIDQIPKIISSGTYQFLQHTSSLNEALPKPDFPARPSLMLKGFCKDITTEIRKSINDKVINKIRSPDHHTSPKSYIKSRSENDEEIHKKKYDERNKSEGNERDPRRRTFEKEKLLETGTKSSFAPSSKSYWGNSSGNGKQINRNYYEGRNYNTSKVTEKSQEQFTSRDKAKSKEKTTSRDIHKNSSGDKGKSQEHSISRDKSKSQENDTVREKDKSQEQATSRDKEKSREPATSQDKISSKEPATSRDIHKNSSSYKGKSQEQAISKDKSKSQENDTVRERDKSQEQATSRDKRKSQEPTTSREKEKPQEQGSSSTMFNSNILNKSSIPLGKRRIARISCDDKQILKKTKNLRDTALLINKKLPLEIPYNRTPSRNALNKIRKFGNLQNSRKLSSVESSTDKNKTKAYKQSHEKELQNDPCSSKSSAIEIRKDPEEPKEKRRREEKTNQKSIPKAYQDAHIRDRNKEPKRNSDKKSSRHSFRKSLSLDSISDESLPDDSPKNKNYDKKAFESKRKKRAVDDTLDSHGNTNKSSPSKERKTDFNRNRADNEKQSHKKDPCCSESRDENQTPSLRNQSISMERTSDDSEQSNKKKTVHRFTKQQKRTLDYYLKEANSSSSSKQPNAANKKFKRIRTLSIDVPPQKLKNKSRGDILNKISSEDVSAEQTDNIVPDLNPESFKKILVEMIFNGSYLKEIVDTKPTVLNYFVENLLDWVIKLQAETIQESSECNIQQNDCDNRDEENNEDDDDSNFSPNRSFYGHYETPIQKQSKELNNNSMMLLDIEQSAFETIEQQLKYFNLNSENIEVVTIPELHLESVEAEAIEDICNTNLVSCESNITETSITRTSPILSTLTTEDVSSEQNQNSPVQAIDNSKKYNEREIAAKQLESLDRAYSNISSHQIEPSVGMPTPPASPVQNPLLCNTVETENTLQTPPPYCFTQTSNNETRSNQQLPNLQIDDVPQAVNNIQSPEVSDQNQITSANDLAVPQTQPNLRSPAQSNNTILSLNTQYQCTTPPKTATPSPSSNLEISNMFATNLQMTSSSPMQTTENLPDSSNNCNQQQSAEQVENSDEVLILSDIILANDVQPVPYSTNTVSSDESNTSNESSHISIPQNSPIPMGGSRNRIQVIPIEALVEQVNNPVHQACNSFKVPMSPNLQSPSNQISTDLPSSPAQSQLSPQNFNQHQQYLYEITKEARHPPPLVPIDLTSMNRVSQNIQNSSNQFSNSASVSDGALVPQPHTFSTSERDNHLKNLQAALNMNSKRPNDSAVSLETQKMNPPKKPRLKQTKTLQQSQFNEAIHHQNSTISLSNQQQSAKKIETIINRTPHKNYDGSVVGQQQNTERYPTYNMNNNTASILKSSLGYSAATTLQAGPGNSLSQQPVRVIVNGSNAVMNQNDFVNIQNLRPGVIKEHRNVSMHATSLMYGFSGSNTQSSNRNNDYQHNYGNTQQMISTNELADFQQQNLPTSTYNSVSVSSSSAPSVVNQNFPHHYIARQQTRPDRQITNGNSMQIQQMSMQMQTPNSSVLHYPTPQYPHHNQLSTSAVPNEGNNFEQTFINNNVQNRYLNPSRSNPSGMNVCSEYNQMPPNSQAASTPSYQMNSHTFSQRNFFQNQTIQNNQQNNSSNGDMNFNPQTHQLQSSEVRNYQNVHRRPPNRRSSVLYLEHRQPNLHQSVNPSSNYVRSNQNQTIVVPQLHPSFQNQAESQSTVHENSAFHYAGNRRAHTRRNSIASPFQQQQNSYPTLQTLISSGLEIYPIPPKTSVNQTNAVPQTTTHVNRPFQPTNNEYERAYENFLQNPERMPGARIPERMPVAQYPE